MKIAVVADVHVHNHQWAGGEVESGLNARCRAVLDTLRRAVAAANDAGCQHFVVAGDLTDVDDPLPQIEAAIITELRAFKGAVHLLVGNHEQHSTLPGDHALGPMDKHETASGHQISVYDQPARVHGTKLGLLPFRPEPVVGWFGEALRKHSDCSVVIAHFGISDGTTPVYLLGSHDQISVVEARKAMRETGTRVLIVGNWHNAQTWVKGTRRIEQVGALCPTGFNNPGPTSYGGLVIVDMDTLAVHREVIPGPRFLQFVWDPSDTDGLLKAIKNSGRSDHVYVDLKASPSAMSEARAWIKSARDVGRVRDFKVTPIRTEVVAQAAKAATSSARAESREASIAAFVKSMPLDAAVSRKSVLRRVMAYVKGAGA